MTREVKGLFAMMLVIVVGSVTLIYGQTSTRTAPARPGAKNNFPPPPPPNGFGHDRGRGPDVYETLGLTEQQRELIGAIKLNTHDAAREHESKMRAADEQLRMMVDEGAFDAEAAKPLITAKSQAFGRIEFLRLTAEVEILNLLTKEQKAQLALAKERRPSPPPGAGFELRQR